MKKKRAEKKTLKRCMVWVLTAAIAFTPSVTSVGTLTAYAVDDYGFGDHVDPNQAEYTNQETSGAQSVEDMKGKVETAKDAVANAEAEVKKVEDAVSEIEEQVVIAEDAADQATDAAGAPSTATQAGTGAAGAAEDAENLVNNLPDADQLMGQVDDYNNRVDATQDKVDNIADELGTIKDSNGNTIVGQIIDENGNTVDVTLEEYVDTQAQAATQAAATAKDKLEEALAVNTDQVTDEVKNLVDEVKDAAEEAKQAADNAQTAVDLAEAKKNEAIKAYNLAAMAHGKPLFGETEITYTLEDVKNAGLTLEEGFNDGVKFVDGEKEKLQGQLDEINGTNLDEQKKVIDAAAAEVDTAAQNFATAQTAAEDAEKIVKEATALIEAEKETAEDAAVDVNDYHIGPAKEALDNAMIEAGTKGKEVVDLENNINDTKEKQQMAVEAAKADGEKAYNDEVERLTKALEEAEEALKNAKWYEKITLSIKRDEAKRALNGYNTDKNKNKVITNSVNNSQAVKEAEAQLAQLEAAYQAANNELTELNKKQANAEAVLKAAEDVKTQYLNEISTAYQNELQDELLEDIKKILGNYSDDINQTQYDGDLYDWAKEKNFPHPIDRMNAKDVINDKYKQDWIKSVLDSFFLTEWMISEQYIEKATAEIEKVYVEKLQAYEEKMATAEVNFAAMDANKIYQTALDKAQEAADAVVEISGFGEQVAEAQTNLAGAQDTYNEAADKLQAMKDKINGATLNSLDLSLLLDRIRSAEAALKAAEDELIEAKAASAAADNYYNWANALITKQYTNAYVQAVVDEMGNKVPNVSNDLDYDLTDEGVASRPKDHFLGAGTSIEVPYSIYRAYVEAMYDKYNYEEVKRGEGISTGGSMGVLFWEVNEEGMLTGNYFTEDDILEAGRYFVGYTFKHENDGYHLDGIMYDFVPEVIIPDGPATPPVTDTTDDTTTVTTIDDAPVALAAAPAAVPAAAPADEAVLGATRDADEAVLGATRDSDNAVLGKRRRPGTGDSAALTVWTVLLVVAAGGTATFAAILAKKKRENREQ